MSDETTDKQEWLNAEARASLLADPEASFHGTAMLSVETSPDAPLYLDWLVVDDFAAFMRFIQPLSPRERETVLSYYVLGASQWQIAKMLGLTEQATVSHALLTARERLSGKQARRVNNIPHETIVRRDPDHLGNFRLNVSQAGDVLSERSGVRRGDGMDYTWER